MRGRGEPQVSMLCVLNPEDMVPKDHPLRAIKELADGALKKVDEQLEAMYASHGRPSVPPERLLKAMLLMALYSIRSDRQLCEQLQYNMLFRWFLDMDMTGTVWDRSTFSHNRERLLESDIARSLFGAVVQQAQQAGLMSAEHFSVDGTLIEAWASLKSFRPKDHGDDDPKGPPDNNGWSDFRGTKRSNKTHESKTDPEAKLAKKGPGKEAKLCFNGHALMENRNGLLVDFELTAATGRAEIEAAATMVARAERSRRITVGADSGYDNREFVAMCRSHNATPHVAQYGQRGNGTRGSAIDRRTTGRPGYSASQIVRKRIEEIFGWAKTVGGLRRSRFKGLRRTRLQALVAATAYNLLRVARLLQPRLTA